MKKEKEKKLEELTKTLSKLGFKTIPKSLRVYFNREDMNSPLQKRIMNSLEKFSLIPDLLERKAVALQILDRKMNGSTFSIKNIGKSPEWKTRSVEGSFTLLIEKRENLESYYSKMRKTTIEKWKNAVVEIDKFK